MEYSPKKNIRRYLLDNSNFLIPAYQRGYKWGVSASNGMSDAQTLISDLLEAYHQNSQREYFIQGVTGYTLNETFTLIDGQQRTTTLFLIVAILTDENLRKKLLFNDGRLKLQYFGRRGKTAKFLEQFCEKGYIEKPEDTQDIHFLCKAIEEIRDMLPKEDQCRTEFRDYILDNTYLFQVEVAHTEAPNVFSMMNGNKADMKIGDLIKAEYLSGLSRLEIETNHYETDNIQDTLSILTTQIQNETATEWKINAARSRYAREWDKWTYWWQRPDVRAFFRVEDDQVTGWLFPLYCRRKKISYSTKIEDRRFVFNEYRKNAMFGDSLRKSFESLRRIQKRMEDIFDNYHSYNLLGFVLCILDSNQRLQALDYFEQQRDNKKLSQYVIFRMASLSHEDAIAKIENVETDTQVSNNGSTIKNFVSLFNGDIYNEPDAKEAAMRYLYLCNVLADDTRKNKFEFFYLEDNELKNYWSFRSLEHIWPKSRVADSECDEKVQKSALATNGISEHVLGNMAFLHRTDNSKFNNLTPSEKRQIYFDLDEKIYSRGMLHTMSAFGGKQWNVTTKQIPAIIKDRHNQELSKLRSLYGQKD